MSLPSLSPSRLTTYLACPHRYYWSYLNARGKWFLRARSSFSFGLSLHAALEKFHEGGSKGLDQPVDIVAVFEESWVDAGYSNAEEMAEAYGEGKAILERYAEEHLEPRSDVATIAVEKAMRHEYPTFALLGRIDRLDEHEDGTLEIVDYKTMRTTVSPEDVRDSVAMGCYQLLIRKAYPGRRIVGTIEAVRGATRASFEFDEAFSEEFEFSLGELARTILCHEWEEMPPVPKGICQECDFVTLCRRIPEYRELEAQVSAQ